MQAGRGGHDSAALPRSQPGKGLTPQSAWICLAPGCISRREALFRGARLGCWGETMRAIVALYLVIGVVLLAIGFLLPGPCPNATPKLSTISSSC